MNRIDNLITLQASFAPWSWPYVSITLMRVIDPKTHRVMWADQRVWSRKYSATKEVVKSFSSRIEEQERGTIMRSSGVISRQ